MRCDDMVVMAVASGAGARLRPSLTTRLRRALNAVDGAQLFAEVGDEGLVAQGLAGDALAQLGGGVAPALGVDVRSEPAQERRHLALAELVVQVGQVAVDG
ncbi:MAG TPA: hypothetical protein VF120_15690, partial [Ktedonobacterales bacterium]